MPPRRNPTDDAVRRGRRQLDLVLDEVRNARRAAGMSQSSVASRVGCSRQQISAIERGEGTDIGIVELVRIGAVVGLDVSLRTFPGGSPLRDAGQLRVLSRFRALVGDLWDCHTEVPVTADPRDRRAFDAVLSRGPVRVGVEAVTRLTDSQAQVRAILLKQQAAGLGSIVLVLADTQHNARALRDAAATVGPAFPLSPRMTLGNLRAGVPPARNGYVLV